MKFLMKFEFFLIKIPNKKHPFSKLKLILKYIKCTDLSWLIFKAKTKIIIYQILKD